MRRREAEMLFFNNIFEKKGNTMTFKKSQVAALSLGTLTLLQSLIVTVSFVPPTPPLDDENLERWESVHEYRRRMNIEYGYETRAVSPELCKSVTEEECETMDKIFEEEVTENKLLQLSTDTFKVLVVPMQFSNHRDKPLPSIEHLQEMWNGVGTNDVIPGGSIANWTNVNSYGNFNIEATVVDWQMTEESESYYADQRSGIPSSGQTPEMEEAFVPLLDALDDQNFDFSKFDQDDNFRIDVTIFLHSGYAAELGNSDCNTGATRLDRLQSFARGFQPGSWISKKGYELGPIVIASAYTGTCNANIARIGTIAHEFMHTFGLPDLYDLGGPLNDVGRVGGLGAYDIMSNPKGQGNRLAYPGHLSPWCKMEMGWLTPKEIKQDGVYTAEPSETDPDVYMISDPYPDGEYLLIENRQPLLFDTKLWSPGGILIYHIDETIDGHGNRYRGFPGQDGWPGNGQHYKVALLQRDGLYELEKALNDGHIDDFWTKNSELGPGNGESIASDTGTYPNTDSYRFGFIETTGFKIHNFDESSESGSGVWKFEVTGLKQETPVEPPTKTPTQNPTRAPVTPNPTPAPSPSPTATPTKTPTQNPTRAPVTPNPTPAPSPSPTATPTQTPTRAPVTPSPTPAPSQNPILTPSPTVTASPTAHPSGPPTTGPTKAPSSIPSESPTTASPTEFPTMNPTNTTSPTVSPSSSPTEAPASLAPSILAAAGSDSVAEAIAQQQVAGSSATSVGRVFGSVIHVLMTLVTLSSFFWQ